MDWMQWLVSRDIPKEARGGGGPVNPSNYNMRCHTLPLGPL